MIFVPLLSLIFSLVIYCVFQLFVLSFTVLTLTVTYHSLISLFSLTYFYFGAIWLGWGACLSARVLIWAMSYVLCCYGQCISRNVGSPYESRQISLWDNKIYHIVDTISLTTKLSYLQNIFPYTSACLGSISLVVSAQHCRDLHLCPKQDFLSELGSLPDGALL